MNSETLRILDSIARDRNIDRELLIEDLEQAMVSAARKHFNSLDTEEFGCVMDRASGVIQLWRNEEDGTQVLQFGEFFTVSLDRLRDANTATLPALFS